MKSEYLIGGIVVEMTPAQADRWNSGKISRKDLDTIQVFLPEPQNQYRVLTLRRATNSRLEPQISDQILGNEAERNWS